jgi:hypothetical protein
MNELIIVTKVNPGDTFWINRGGEIVDKECRRVRVEIAFGSPVCVYYIGIDGISYKSIYNTKKEAGLALLKANGLELSIEEL